MEEYGASPALDEQCFKTGRGVSCQREKAWNTWAAIDLDLNYTYI